MAEQSSTVVTFRALVMLICLVLVPVAAFCGGSYPAVVKAIQSGRWPTLADFHAPASSSTAATEAPRFVPPADSSPRRTAADLQTTGLPSPVGSLGIVGQGETTHSQVVAANYNAPVESIASTGTRLSAAVQGKDTVSGGDRPPFALPRNDRLAFSRGPLGQNERWRRSERRNEEPIRVRSAAASPVGRHVLHPRDLGGSRNRNSASTAAWRSVEILASHTLSGVSTAMP